MATRREARVAAARLPRRADTVTTAGFRVARLPAVSLEEAGTGVAGAMLRFGWDSESGDYCSGVSTVCGADTGAAFGVFTDDLRLTVARALEDVRDFAGGRSVAGWRTVLSLGLLADAEERGTLAVVAVCVAVAGCCGLVLACVAAGAIPAQTASAKTNIRVLHIERGADIQSFSSVRRLLDQSEYRAGCGSV